MAPSTATLNGRRTDLGSLETRYIHVPQHRQTRQVALSETDRSSGENLEKEFIVPRLLDIIRPALLDQPARCRCPGRRLRTNIGAEGEIVVCQPGKGQPGDIEFLGDPTPDMIPMDEEAEEISRGFADHWAWKPDTAEPNYSQSIVDRHGEVSHQAEVKIAGLDNLSLLWKSSPA